MNHCFTCFLQLSHDAVQGIPPFPCAELPLNLAAFSGFQPFQFLLSFGDGWIRIGFPEFRTVEMDAMPFAVSQIVPRTEDRIGQHPSGVLYTILGTQLLTWTLYTVNTLLFAIVLPIVIQIHTNILGSIPLLFLPLRSILDGLSTSVYF